MEAIPFLMFDSQPAMTALPGAFRFGEPGERELQGRVASRLLSPQALPYSSEFAIDIYRAYAFRFNRSPAFLAPSLCVNCRNEESCFNRCEQEEEEH
jgi:hypothetical protein